jgi:translocator protein
MPSFDLMLLVFVGFCCVPASVGAFFMPGEWYEVVVKKPTWCPPNWLFGPVWAVLYLMIATSGWLVWHAVGWEAGAFAFAVYAVQLFFASLWSPIFFGLRRPDLALIEIVFLWTSIVVNVVVFYQISEMAAWMLVPYLCWASFAGFLNFTIVRMNPRNRVSEA